MDTRYPGTRSTDGYELSSRYWELIPGLQQKH